MKPYTITAFATASIVAAAIGWTYLQPSVSQEAPPTAGAELASAVSETSALAYDDSRWWYAGEGRVFPQLAQYANAFGTLQIQYEDGPLDTAGHPFFEPLGPTGRACITCHQPSDSMSLSAATLQAQWDYTDGNDPVFAAIDGSNCPTLPQEDRASHSLLLERGLFRIERPWPPAPFLDFPETAPDFSIEVVRDPNGCNSGPEYGPEAGRISVYRRPRPAANMKYVLAVGFEYDPKQGLPLPLDRDGNLISGNLMADNRAATLEEQMNDAASSHQMYFDALTPEEVDQIETFLMNVYSAQQVSNVGGELNDLGAGGGTELLAESIPGQLGSIGSAVFSEFQAWENMTEEEMEAIGPEATAWRQSAARGARVFRERTFLISDSAGINSPVGFGNPVRNSCVFCHNMRQMGMDIAPGQVDLGTTTLPYAVPSPELPLFRITCHGEPHPHYGETFLTQDPGFALSTGRCADVGKITLQSMRGLSGRAPYFSNGSAADLRELVDYYDRRYNIGYTEQEKQDLVNLMRAL